MATNGAEVHAEVAASELQLDAATRLRAALAEKPRTVNQRAACACLFLEDFSAEILRDLNVYRQSMVRVGGKFVSQSRPPRPRSNAVDVAGRVAQVSARLIFYARAVRQQDPALFAMIEIGSITVARAWARLRMCEPPELMTSARRIEQIRELAAKGNRRDQIAQLIGLSCERVGTLAKRGGVQLPDRIIGRTRRINVHRVVEETVVALEGLEVAVNSTDLNFSEIAPPQAGEWVRSLTSSLATLQRLRKQLREIANGI